VVSRRYRRQANELVLILPNFAEVVFKLPLATGSREFRGMVRDLPGIYPRRITNLDTGSELFVDDELELELVQIHLPAPVYADAVVRASI
jgi:hypothetical protein